MWFIDPVQNFGKNCLTPSNFRSSMTNGHKWRTLFRVYEVLFSQTWTFAPWSWDSMAVRRPQGPPPTIHTYKIVIFTYRHYEGLGRKTKCLLKNVILVRSSKLPQGCDTRIGYCMNHLISFCQELGKGWLRSLTLYCSEKYWIMLFRAKQE